MMIVIAVLVIAAAAYDYSSRRPDAPAGDATVESAPESVAVVTTPVSSHADPVQAIEK